jgi:hypothetical protein
MISQGKKEKLRRYMISMIEKGATVVRETAKRTGNSTITQFIFLADIDGFGYGSHACFSCKEKKILIALLSVLIQTF